MPISEQIAFVGGGKMAEAILRALLASPDLIGTPCQITVCEPVATRRQALAALGVTTTPDNRAALAADVLLLCVQPGVMPDMLGEIGGHLGARHLLVSIAAGVPLARIRALIHPEARLVRVMPNLLLTVRAGAAAIARGPNASDADIALVRAIFEAGGRVVELPESALDAVTGLSGSGPAFIFVLIEALADGGVKVGLPRDVALLLAAQTVLGSAQLLLETGEHPAVWKDRVATPGGTTIAGLAELEAGGLRSALIRAVEAATLRARDLSQGSR
ncbi:MAG: pyrroline-5-carboxylate reductase [Armatimonadetes bacterium]|nr:pyrroline-5-carboxylate reductase [Armatimonadota bacterium]